MAIQTVSDLNSNTKFKIPARPVIDEAEQLAALQIAEKLDSSVPSNVLNLGVAGQKGLSELNEKLLENVSLSQAGTGGQILENLIKVVALVNPSKSSFWYGLIGKNDAQSRISRLTASLDKVSPAIEYLSDTLAVKIKDAQQYVQEADQLILQNAKWMSNLRIVNAALVFAIEREAERYEKMREKLGPDAGFLELEKLKTAWNDLQRLDRRRGAIQASFGLSVKIHMQLSQVRETHLYDIEMLKEADEFLIPNWQLEIRTQISALKAEGHLKLGKQFRESGDAMVRSSTDALAAIENLHAEMESRTFASFDVIADANNALAKAIREKLVRQKKAAEDREAGIQKMLQSQRNLAESLQDSAKELLETSGLNTSLKPDSADLSAQYLH